MMMMYGHEPIREMLSVLEAVQAVSAIKTTYMTR